MRCCSLMISCCRELMPMYRENGMFSSVLARCRCILGVENILSDGLFSVLRALDCGVRLLVVMLTMLGFFLIWTASRYCLRQKSESFSFGWYALPWSNRSA